MAQIDDDSEILRAFTPALVLLAICSLISYVDRGNLSIARHPARGLSPFR